MFDANARMLPVGHQWFGAVSGVKEGGQLDKLGIKSGDILPFTTKVTGCWGNHKENIKACAIVHLDSGDHVFMDWDMEDKYYSRILYEGNWNGDGFICDESKRKFKEYSRTHEIKWGIK